MNLDALLAEYSASHQNRLNKVIHRIAVPIIALDILGLARTLPTRELFGPAAPTMATVTALLALIYYARLSPALAAGMSVLAALGLALLAAGQHALGPAFVPVLVAIFVIAWTAQFYGHAVEGKRPAFLRDLQFLLIGPLWLLADAYERLAEGATQGRNAKPPPAR